MRPSKWRDSVEISLEGENLGRFFSLCARNGVKLFDIKMTENDCAVVCVFAKDVWTLHPLLKKTHTHIRIQKKSGPFLFMNRYRKRILFPLACIFVLFLFGYMSGFVWKIDIRGNSYLSTQSILSYLETQHISVGSRKRSIDCEALELSLRRDLNEVIWSSVSINGTNLSIEIEERRKNAMPSTADSAGMDAGSVGYDLIADEDARITSIITRSGCPLVKAGDVVKKGDVLVRGIQEVFDDDNQIKQVYYVIADADISAAVRRNYTDKIPVVTDEKILTDRHTHSIAVSFADRRIELPLSLRSSEGEDLLQTHRQLCLGTDFYLPVTITKTVAYEVEEKKKAVGKEEAIALANAHYALYKEECETADEKITGQTIKMIKNKDNYTVTGTVLLQRQIGVPAASKENNETEGMKQRGHE